jgi:hypothetical protein
MTETKIQIISLKVESLRELSPALRAEIKTEKAFYFLL